MPDSVCPAVPQCDSFLLQSNMSNPKEHCNMGFSHICVVEGGAYVYTVRLGEMPPGVVEMRVTGEFLQYEPVIEFTPEDFDQPHRITVVLAENLDITGNYWMELRHNLSLVENGESTDERWYSARVPLDLNTTATAWTPGKLWCDTTGSSSAIVDADACCR